MGAGMIVPQSHKTKGNQNIFQARPIFLNINIIYDPLYLLKIVFPKFDSLTATGMALCVDLGQNCKIYSS